MTRAALALALGISACGGGDEPAPQAPSTPAPSTAAPPPAAAPAAGGLSTPEWIRVDHTARTVTLDLVAGSTNANNYWNFNGFFGGTGDIVVPQGYAVTLNLRNADPAMAHSVGVSQRMATYPPMITDATPVFPGAVTANPTSMTESTLPGETETITFTAATAGEYALVCYVTGHAATGMWVKFTVAAGQDVGVRQ